MTKTQKRETEREKECPHVGIRWSENGEVWVADYGYWVWYKGDDPNNPQIADPWVDWDVVELSTDPREDREILRRLAREKAPGPLSAGVDIEFTED